MSSVKLRSVRKLEEDGKRSQSRVSFEQDKSDFMLDDLDNKSPRGDGHPVKRKKVREDKNTPVRPLKRFVRGIKGFWDTTTMVGNENEDREAFVRTTLRELFVYLGFVLTVCLIAFLMLDSTMFYLTKVMQGLFVDDPGFTSITDVDGFWKYVSGGLVDGLYKEQYYDGADVHHTEIGYIFNENKIFGRPRLRQLRVRNDTCKVHQDMETEFDRCFGAYSEDHEERINFRGLNGTAWNYLSADALDGRSFGGRRNKYGGGGYTQLLSDNKLESQAIISRLKQNKWIDRGTRAVFIDFTVYNANINMFNLVRLLWEFTPTGGCVPFKKLTTIKLLRYVTSTDYFVMACEGILFLYLVFYAVEEILEMKKLKLKYFRDFWSLLDLMVILLGTGCLVLNLYRTFKVSTVLKDVLDNRDSFANFELVAYWQELFNDIVAVTCFFTWLKIFKYISFNQTMAHLSGTLNRCAIQVAAFAISFSICFFGFAHWGYLCFGSNMKDYHTLVSCLFTLFRIILGDFNFNAMSEAKRTWGPIYFITYIFFVFFILLNMFLAIINDTYAEVKEDMGDEVVDVGGIFKKGYDKMLTSLAIRKNAIADIREALLAADTNQDNMVDFEEMRAQLKARGHYAAEIEAVFAKYDLDGDRVLNEEEQKRMIQDFDFQQETVEEEIEEVKQKKTEAKKLFSKLDLRNEDAEDDESESDTESEASVPEVVGYEEYKTLTKRVDTAEHNVGTIVSKIEALLTKLEAMDKAKAKRRETMSRLIENIAEYESKVENTQQLLRATSVMGSQVSFKPKGSVMLRPESHDKRKMSKVRGSSLSFKTVP